jgi:hypothetical protein
MRRFHRGHPFRVHQVVNPRTPRQIILRPFDILKMCAMFQSHWVHKLIGKPRVPYNRGLRVRGSSHPFFDYAADFSPPTAALLIDVHKTKIRPDSKTL